jgi:hypothetical protein
MHAMAHTAAGACLAQIPGNSSNREPCRAIPGSDFYVLQMAMRPAVYTQAEPASCPHKARARATARARQGLRASSPQAAISWTIVRTWPKIDPCSPDPGSRSCSGGGRRLPAPAPANERGHAGKGLALLGFKVDLPTVLARHHQGTGDTITRKGGPNSTDAASLLGTADAAGYCTQPQLKQHRLLCSQVLAAGKLQDRQFSLLQPHSSWRASKMLRSRHVA